VGARRSWTFLFRTPSPVEAGIRSLLASALADEVTVRNRKLPLHGSNLTINPDLVFEDPTPRAIGDVKYKLASPEWDRPDLYEVVSFAAGYRVPRALVALFAEPGVKPLPSVAVGDHVVSPIAWSADALIAASEAAESFSTAVRQWYLEEDAPSSGY
jgi:hypothetical protein